MNSVLRVFVILCLFIHATNCLTLGNMKQQLADRVLSEKRKDDSKAIDIDIKNEGGGLRISLPTGEIYVPLERKNVHIKTIDVFEEKTPMTQPAVNNGESTPRKRKFFGSEDPEEDYESNDGAYANNIPQPNPYQAAMNPNLYPYQSTPFNIPQQPYSYPPIPANYPQQPYGYQPSPMNYGQFTYQPVPISYPQQPVSYQPIMNYPNMYPPNKQQKETTKPEKSKSVFWNIFSKFQAKKETEFGDKREGEGPVIKGKFPRIIKFIATILATVFNITLSPAVFQAINGLAKYLFLI